MATQPQKTVSKGTDCDAYGPLEPPLDNWPTYPTSEPSYLATIKKVVFHILDSPDIPIIFRHPWMRKHNLHINWSNHNILGLNSFASFTACETP